MSYKEAYALATDIADQAREQMVSLEIAPYPDNYEVWYAYHAGIDAELSRKLTGLLENIDQFDPGAYQSIKNSYLGEETSQLLQSASDSVESLIAGALTSIGAASSNVKDYGSSLEGFSGDLEKADPKEIRSLVAKVMADTKDVMTRNAKLEADLQTSGSRIEALRDSLDDARRASETDGLTGLPNRRAFDLGFEAEIDRAREDRTPLTLLMTDVDHFKKFNDTFGHRVGDEVLKLVGRVMKSLLKGRDTPARCGGEEFCVILPTTGVPGGIAVGEQIRKAIGAKALKSARTGQSYGQITLSIGCATLNETDTADTLIERADAALYYAKNNGRNRTCSEIDLAESGAFKQAS
ncbi:MAG: GGDEF domain-containing protein [Alphaproteobacteria bacterium]